MSAKFIITSCPAPLERLEAACASTPPIGDRDDPGASLSSDCITCGRKHRAAACVALLDHVRQQAEKARALDGLRELALLFRRNGGDAARYDFAALRSEERRVGKRCTSRWSG